MGHAIYLYGRVKADEKYEKMKAVWDACKEAGTEIPDEVEEFFDDEPPVDHGKLKKFFTSWEDHYVGGKVESWPNEMEEAFEIPIDQIPKSAESIIVVINYD